MTVRARWAWLPCVLLTTACVTPSATRRNAVVGTSVGEGRSLATARPAPRAYVVPTPAHLRSDELRCRERPISQIAYDRTLDGAMSHVETASNEARQAPAKPIYLGVRQCGPYRAVTIGDRHHRARMVYDDAGALVAAFADNDVIEQKCLVGLDDATIHYGKRVDCTESDLVYPAN